MKDATASRTSAAAAPINIGEPTLVMLSPMMVKGIITGISPQKDPARYSGKEHCLAPS